MDDNPVITTEHLHILAKYIRSILPSGNNLDDLTRVEAVLPLNIGDHIYMNIRLPVSSDLLMAAGVIIKE